MLGEISTEPLGSQQCCRLTSWCYSFSCPIVQSEAKSLLLEFLKAWLTCMLGFAWRFGISFMIVLDLKSLQQVQRVLC